MHYNGKQLKLIVLEGLVTKERLRSSHHLSRLIVNGNPFPEIETTEESENLDGRKRIGSPIYHNIGYSHNKGNHHLEFAVANALHFARPGVGLVLVSHYENPLEKVISVEYYSKTPEETIEYFI